MCKIHWLKIKCVPVHIYSPCSQVAPYLLQILFVSDNVVASTYFFLRNSPINFDMKWPVEYHYFFNKVLSATSSLH